MWWIYLLDCAEVGVQLLVQERFDLLFPFGWCFVGVGCFERPFSGVSELEGCQKLGFLWTSAEVFAAHFGLGPVLYSGLVVRTWRFESPCWCL